MGFAISWIAFQGITKDEALARTGLRDTGEPDEMRGAAFSGAVLPNGWYLIHANDTEYVTPELVEKMSPGCRAVGMQLYETVMLSTACAYENGARTWEIWHFGSEGTDDLDVEGTPPSEFAALRERYMKQQEESGGPGADVDYIFEIPIETAAAVCGFRHDDFEPGKESFTRLEPV